MLLKPCREFLLEGEDCDYWRVHIMNIVLHDGYNEPYLVLRK
jgi:hypothetical protein